MQAFWRLALITMAANITTPLASVIDMAFLGHLSDLAPLAGVALASVVFDYLFWSCGFLRMATTGLTAQALGRNDLMAAGVIALRHGAVALVLGLAIAILQIPLRELSFSLLQGSEAAKLAGAAYFEARIWSAPVALLNFVVWGWLLGLGRGRAIFGLTLVGNIANVALNALLIPGYGSAGAGWATTLSQVILAVVGLGMIGRQLPWAAWSQIRDREALHTMFLLNRDLLIRTWALLTAFAVFTNLSAGFSDQVLAANALLLQVQMLAAYGIDGIAYATESYAGQRVGQPDALTQVLRWGLLGSVLLAWLFAGVYMLWPRQLLGLLTQHQAVIGLGQRSMIWLLPVLTCGSVAYMLDGYFMGLTAGKTLRQSTLWATLLGFLPIAIASAYFQLPQGLWLAMTLLMAVRAAILARGIAATLV